MRRKPRRSTAPEIHVLHGLLDGPMHGRYGRNEPRHDDMLVAAVNGSLACNEDESQVSIAGVLDAEQVGNINVRNIDRFCDVLKIRKQSKPPIGQTNGGSRRDSSYSSQIAYVEQLFNDHGYRIVNGCTQPAIDDRLCGPVREWGVTRP